MISPVNCDLSTIWGIPMDTSVVTEIIRRSNRNLALRSGLGLLVIVAAVVLTRNYLINFFSGPFTVEKADVLAITDINQIDRTFVTLTGDDVTYTRYNEFETRDSGAETITKSYAALFLDDRLLLVEVEGNQEEFPLTFTGGLVATPGDIQSDVINALELEVPELKGAFLPFILKTEDFRRVGYIGIAIGGVILILSLIGLFRTIQRNTDMTRHPIMRRLAQYGEPDVIAEQVDREMSQEHTEVGKLHLTRSWLLHTQPTALEVARLQDVMWAYKKVTQHRTYGIVVRKSYTVLIWDRNNVCITIPARNEDEAHTMLEALLTRAPSTVIGYDANIEKSWRQDRDGFIAAVEQRRREQRN
jgi:hypothetical protein